jgi:hypothetical protein
VRNARFVYVVMALTFLGVACAPNAAQNGVNVKTVATNLTYGVPKTPPPAEPANSNPVPPNPLPVKLDIGPLPTSLPPIGPPPTTCPTASLTDFPTAAPTSIVGRPLAGRYQWKVTGFQTVPGIGKYPLATYSPRIVSAVQTTSNGFSFVVEERELVFGSTFNVFTTYEDHTSGNKAQPPGLYLTKIERQSRTDKTANSTFTPSPPILFLPTPVVLGTSVNSVGIDPTTLEVLQVKGNVLSRKRVDACGKLVDTFYVHTQQSYASGGTTTTREFDYGVATGMGGLPAIEHIDSPCVQTASGTCDPSAVTFHMDAHIAQLKPSGSS